MRNTFDQIRSSFNYCSHVLIAVHTDPDGDALGSALALSLMFKKLGVKTTLYSQSEIPQTYHFLPNIENFVHTLPEDQKFGVGIIVDCGDIKRAGSNIDLKEHIKTIINIDHHSDSTMFGDINYVQMRSAVAEQVFDLLKYFEVEIDVQIAECLYTAIITDTGNFRYDRTTEKTFLIAAELTATGINVAQIAMNIYETRTFASVKLMGRVLSNLKISSQGKVVWAVIDKDVISSFTAKGDDMTGLVDQLRCIKGVEVAILLREEGENAIKVNFRGKGSTNVQKIAKELGGGGHIKAAGALINSDIKQAEKDVIEVTFKHIEDSYPEE